MSPFLAIVIIGVATYAMRLSFVAIFGSRGAPMWMEAPLRYIAPAVFAAIVAPALFAPEGSLDLSFDNVRWIAGLFALGAALKTRSIAATVAFGMLALWVLQALFQ